MERIKIYAKTLEEEAKLQIEEMVSSKAYNDCIIRIMPDCHAGSGCTIGTVVELKDKVVPNTVGVDIGCGMLVYELGNIEVDLVKLDEVINKYIPSGFNIHEKQISNFDSIKKLKCFDIVDINMATRSIGTLGGGNHFIELNEDNDGNKYLVIHSGSRNLGVRVCKYYQNIATTKDIEKSRRIQEVISTLKEQGRERDIQKALKEINGKNTEKGLEYLESEYLANYLHDMKVCQRYASVNRENIGITILSKMNIEPISSFQTIHNYIDINSFILRKGAVSAEKGEKLIIPINMKDGSLICIGKGNEDWLNSAPHGAGRLMSRKKAKASISLNEFEKSMDGIYSTSICENTIDESPMAYKPMDEIIECITDTVDIVNIIKPLYNFKAKE